MSFTLAVLLVAAGATFDGLKSSALALERPGQAVAVLVGACDMGGGAVSGECLENTQALKDQVSNKRVLLDLGAGHESFLSFEGRHDGKTRFAWAPFYDVGNGLALSVGRPQKLSAQGTVVMPKRPIDGHSPEELSDLDLSRLAKTGLVGVQIIGRFTKPWSLSGAKTVKGIAFEVEALRLYNARSGATLFESTQTLK